MSVFERISLPCPACKAPVDFELVHSVNAVRRPDLRDDILSRRFQRQACAACGTAFRMPPQFSYLDLGRRQFISAQPPQRLAEWPELERHAQASFDQAYGPGADGHALAEGMQPRLVFGWAALAEKLVCADLGLDDRVLELAKLAVLRRSARLDLDPGLELRLLGRDGERLVLAWLRHGGEEAAEELELPAALLSDIAARLQDWGPALGQVAGGPFVDLRRALAGAA